MPEVLAVSDDPPILALEWIEQGPPGSGTEEDLGRALADLHAAGAPSFGREDRRTTGSRGLPNEPCATWAEFYATQRLLPLARLARDGAALPEATVTDLERVAGRLDELGGPTEPPARLREFDLAMMRLFGGFGAACFAAYQEAHPLADGWEARVSLHQLAPLTVHAIKFGGGYVAGTQRALAQLR